ncbi:HNH endonuclease [Paenibacillus alba]|uniref:HNH endonuclease signature motif containing protein n=1 Tax=Paenibacillus alba TaxID=1197127 RepID=UPI001563AD29|nr:HNH endonuclease signature motif containing protein [Paenibacillus alba]NQX68474.1 HNH endonuclease [Paenibacillus alba]
MALKKFCRKSGCRELTEAKYCTEHIGQDLVKERERGSAAQRGYDSAWRKARLHFLKKHPLCVHCDNEGSIGAATVVDHIKPHKGDKGLFWERANWQPLCKRHHDIKTATEDGGFGR